MVIIPLSKADAKPNLLSKTLSMRPIVAKINMMHTNGFIKHPFLSFNIIQYISNFCFLGYTLSMEIVIINEAKDRSIYRYKKDYERILQRTSDILNRHKDWSLSVIFVTPEQIHEINKEYRKIDRPTDVISFALQDDLSDVLIEESMCELGDIFINVQAIRDQAKEYGHSLRREACFLFCHGLLHLMGYDHMEPEEEKVMFELQDVILDEVVSR